MTGCGHAVSVYLGCCQASLLVQMMTPFQLANIVVQTYPWVPDTGALLNILAAQEGQPSAMELLGFADGSVADFAPVDSSAQNKGHV